MSAHTPAYDAALHDKHIERFRQVDADLPDEDDNGEDKLIAQLCASMDMAVAQMIRNDRRGKGKGLRANGMHETADLLGL